MKPRHREVIRRVSRAIADSRDVDWTEPDDADAQLRSRLRRLQAIWNLAEAFRSRPPGMEPDPNVPSAGALNDRPSAHHALAATEGNTLFTWGPLLAREKLGEGSFGEVFRAFDPVLQRDVALKLKRREETGSPASGSLAHLEEARRLARVRHPNVLTVHGIEIHEGRAGLWTELIEGETLEAALQTSGPQGPEEIVVTGVELCRALGAVHAAGITHGDVKATNVMVEPGGRVILMDFGAGSLQGTPLAMAPELFAGAPPSTATDLYALGVLLFRLATGRYPVAAATEAELIDRHRRGERTRLADARPDLPEWLAGVIEKAAAPEPAARFRSAGEMEAALESALDLPLARLSDSPRPSVPNNLPPLRDRFVGRERDRRLVRRRLSTARLVTIVGAGGCGKTRLARHVAADMAAAFPSGVWWVDLTAIRQPEQIWDEIARLLEIRESAGRSLEKAVLTHLRAASSLLVLDNCEHLPSAPMSLSEAILRDCPGARILATSRRPLGSAAESVYRLPPLQAPSDGGAAAAPEADLLNYDSVRLFVDRAARSRPDFVLTAANAPDVARICRRVEGIPLAIELAAARARAMNTHQIASRLEQGFRLLRQTAGERPPHHRTLAVCIDWSYGQLAPPEQTLLRRLAGFSGGWTLEAAERICADNEESPGLIAGEQIVDLLEKLVDHSLVVFEAPDAQVPADPAAIPEARHSHSMLEMIRQYAQELLASSGEEARLRARHRDDFLALAEEAEAKLRGSEQDAWIRRLEAERDNLRAAIAWTLRSPEEVDKAIRFVTNLRGFWLVRGYVTEGYRACLAVLEQAEPTNPMRGRALWAACSLAWRRGDFDAARRWGEEAEAGWRVAGDEFSLSLLLGLLGTLSYEQGRYAEGRAQLEEAVELTRKTRGRPALPGLLCNLGVLAANLGDLARAAAYYKEALAIYREIGNHQLAAAVLGNLAATAMDLGDIPRARSLAEESVAALRRTEDHHSLAGCLHTLGRVAFLQRDLDLARESLLEAISLHAEREHRGDIARDFLTLGYVSEVDGHAARAVRLLAAAESIREGLGSPLPAGEEKLLAASLERLRAALGPDAFAAERAAGRSMTLAQSVAFARGQPVA